MIESSLRLHIQRGLQSQGAFCFKIPDLAQAIIKPCDLIVGLNRQLWLVEVKLRKTAAKRGLVGETIVVSRNDFRPHQLPTLFEAHEKNQARSWIAVGIAAESMGRVVARRVWLLPAMIFKSEEINELTIEWLDTHFSGNEMVWQPKVGYIAPWLPVPE